MVTINPKELKTSEFHSYLLGAVAPRPIAFASTVDKDGNPNLAPFSFFNVFSANPPIAVFSPARSGRTGNQKHTFMNIMEVPEVVINVVNYDMVQQTSLASTEYPKEVNEFEKSGFTAVPSVMIRPMRVKESPAQLECIVKQVIELGDQGGAGNLIICEIVLMHISEHVLDANKRIDPEKMDLVGRMGGNWYSRTNGKALFEVEKPISTCGIGYDNIPSNIRNSKVLTGNHLGQLGNIERLPTQEEIMAYRNSGAINEAFEIYGGNLQKLEEHLHHIAKGLLENNKMPEAWKVLLSLHHY